MSGNKITTGVGIELVRKLANEGDRIFDMARARELAPAAGISGGYLCQALHHLVKTSWIIRLRKGLYSVSSSVPGVTPAHDFEIAMALVHPAAISHWSALHYHGLTEQAPRKTFVLTTTQTSAPRLRPRKVGRGNLGHQVPEYQFIQVKPERFFGMQKVWIGEARVVITDVERTIIDGLSMPQYCGDFAEVLHAIKVRGSNLNVERIVEYALALDAATAKRLGWALENEGIEPSRLEALLRLPIKGYRKLDPTGPQRGPCNRRWMIQENLPGRVKA